MTSISGKWRVGILTLSDKGAKGERTDESGPLVASMLDPEKYEIVATEIVADEVDTIVSKLCAWVDGEQVQLIVTTGGTGVSPRDVTPEATLKVIDYTIPGMAEAMRAESMKKTPHAMLSRAIVGVRASSLIINLPGSPRGARENLEVLLPALGHGLLKIAGDPSDCGSL